jgi:hypothetical protein
MFNTEILIKGKIDPTWSDWFEDLQIQPRPSGDTLLTGCLPDRSAVYGVISRLGSLGMTMLSFNCQEEDSPGTSQE